MTQDTGVTNVDELLTTFDAAWEPRVVGAVNDWALKLARFRGEYVWHAHADTDELFLVKDGAVEIDIDSDGSPRTVHLGPGDVLVVPRGIRHRPRSVGGAAVFMMEPAATLSTGDYSGDVPPHITSTTGVTAVTTGVTDARASVPAARPPRA